MMHLKDEEEKVSRLLHSELEALKVQYSDLKRSLIDDETEKENLRQQIFHLRSELKKKDDALTTQIASIPQNSKEMTNLSEKIKMLEDLIKSKEIALETSASSLLEKERELQSKVEELEDKVEELNQRIK
ncbi:myosin-11-like, partial [Trifolium medium]|nr:myosin-11-like [Trifolium medium]